MKTIFDLQEELAQVRLVIPEAFGIEYYSKSNRSNCHKAIMRSEAEFQNLRDQSRDWDFVFNVLAI